MKKIFPLLLIFIMLNACTSINPADEMMRLQDTAEKAYVDVIQDTSTGILYALVLIEAQNNLSSLFIDKTKENVLGFTRNAVKELPQHATYYILPAKVTRAGETSYNERYGRIVRNYIFMTGRGDVTTNLSEADYIVLTDVKESIDRRLGSNESQVTVSIMNQMDLPVFYTSIKLQSKSDDNFWYFPSKTARPVKYLTMKSFGLLMEQGMPAAFGEPGTFKEKMTAKIKEYADKNLSFKAEALGEDATGENFAADSK